MNHAIGGLIPNVHVGEVLPRFVKLRSEAHIVVIRSLDSSFEPEDLGRILRFHSVEYHVTHGNVCVSVCNIDETSSARLFTGFDEVWLYERAPSIDLASVPGSTSASVDFSRGVPQETVEAAGKTGCLLLMADGCGLNYLTLDGGAASDVAKIAAEF